MTAQTPSGSDEERAARALVDETVTNLQTASSDVPKDFAKAMLAHASAEDLLAYTPSELAELVHEAWAFLAARKPGAPKIRFVSLAPGAGPGLAAVSVLEIVNDDMPFLVDSVMGELAERALDIRFVVHPIFTIVRDAGGCLTGFRGRRNGDGEELRESFIHIHVDRIDDDIRRTEIVQALEHTLADVRVCVQDWRPMLARVQAAVDELKSNPPPVPVDEIAEVIQFLEWLLADNFTFLGVRDYRIDPASGEMDADFASGLGLLRSPDNRVIAHASDLKAVTNDANTFLRGPELSLVTRANLRSRVHRRASLDYVGVKRFDAAGTLTGEFRLVGLFTSTAYTRSTRSIPYLRRKVDAVLGRAGFDPDSHSGKALVNVLEHYPRDEMFQVDEDTLHRFALTILQLNERPRVRVLARLDRFDRFVSVLVYIPRERYDSEVRAAIGDYLAATYRGRLLAFSPFFPEGPLVRVHFVIARSQESMAEPSQAQLDRDVRAIVRTWIDGLADALEQAYEPGDAHALMTRYREAFSDGYREDYSAATAVSDIRVIETLSAERPLAVDFHTLREAEADGVGLKVWSYNRPIPLSERVPVLENMGFRVVDERTYHVTPPSEPGVWFHDMVLASADGTPVALDESKERLEAAFLAVMGGDAENDGHNALVLIAGLAWRDVALIRTISRFLRQIRIPYSQDYLWTTLRHHPKIAADLVALFHARFDPRIAAEEREQRGKDIARGIEEALEAVESLDEDRILRHFLNAVQVALRTSYFQHDEQGRPRALIAIKFSSRKVDALPLPRPLYEIFVYSPRVEGVHLRFGKVARGGIRWSDRPQDFRTEILGLVKAQQVKNAVIVPVGAKGGFVPKLLPKGGQRDAIQAEGTAAYKLFIAALLDITDNIATDGVIPPPDTVRYDDDDPYLVVAADKGTATFSDIANGIAIEHGFWLGDAFASGGSAGYDHKKMGITARGAWESVKRHFREMDVEIAATPFTVTGVGDMSGDVFGNGMLREKTIRLVAAFDHRDIFIDPDPDAEKSFAERARLFALPRSSWQDYDKSLISQGGGVFPRNAKEIKLSPQAQALLGLKDEAPTPRDVMRAILKAPVDLLFFGGIGTYVRASTESDEAAGDRANDGLRITGAELACKVIGEGANLGMTQRSRVEAALKGVRLNTDAIDNSAGVNTSDIEVNLKIALARPIRDNRLSLADRDKLLADMTDDVAKLVLRNNYQQTLALSLTERRGLDDLGFQQRLMQTLEQRALLDRTVEFLPDDMELAERRRRNQPLTRPELAVLLAYGKLALNHDLIESRVPDEAYLARELGRYFPARVTVRYPDALEHHRLRREIIATQLSNSMINRGGPALVVRIADQTGASAADIAAAFAVVRDSYGMTTLNTAIEALDGKVEGEVQLDLLALVQDVLLDRLVWFLRNVDLSKGLAAIVDRYRDGIEAVGNALETALSPDAAAARAARQSELIGQGIPEDLARRIANLPASVAAPDIVQVADKSGKPIAEVAATYFAAVSYFRIDRITTAARAIVVSDYFDRLALDRALDTIGAAERRIAAAIVADGATGGRAIEDWIAAHRAEVERTRASVHEIAASGLTLSKLSVAASMLGDLVKE